MRRCSVPNSVERRTFLRWFLISNHCVGVHGGVQDMMLKLRKTIPVVWVLIVALGALSPVSTALGSLAQDSPVPTTTALNVNVSTSVVMIRSLNISIQVAISKLMSLNISKSNTEWQLVEEANQSLRLAIQANITGNYSAAVKYAQEGLAKIRKALELLAQEYRVRTNESIIKAIRYESNVRALNRTAHELLNTTIRAEERGAINVTVAEKLRATLQNDVKALSKLAKYLAKVVNQTETLNATYVASVLNKVGKDLASVRESLNNCAAKKLQEIMRARVMEQLKVMLEEVAGMTQVAHEAQERNLTVMAQKLTEIARNLRRNLMKIEEKLMNTATSFNVSEVEKLINITSQVKVLASISHEIKYYNEHASSLKTVMSDLARLRTTITQLNTTYIQLKSMSKRMTSSMAKEVTDMGKLMKALQGNYSELEKALAEGNPEKVRECLNTINATVTQLSNIVNEMMQEKVSGSFENQVRATLKKMDSDLKAVMEQIRERLHSAEKVAKQAQTSRSTAAEAELKMAMKQLEKAVTLGKVSKALTPAQISKIQEVQVSLSKAVTLLKNGNAEEALKVIKTSIEVLKEIQHEVSVTASKGGAIVSTEVEVIIEILHAVQAMIER